MRKTAKPQTPVKLNLGPLKSLVGFNIRQAQLAVYDDFMRGAPIRGLTPGQLALLVLVDENPNITQQRLCEGIRVEKSTLVVRLHRLAERGLIQRVRSTEDRRQNGLRLTKKGKAAMQGMLSFVALHERKIASDLSVAERKQLIDLLDRIG
jgi:DNA-binding MarR family transcriptional regulator